MIQDIIESKRKEIQRLQEEIRLLEMSEETKAKLEQGLKEAKEGKLSRFCHHLDIGEQRELGSFHCSSCGDIEVKEEQNENITMIDDLIGGDIFWMNNQKCMRIESEGEENAVNLSNGVCFCLHPFTKVRVCNRK